jgi:hypothetical protein
MEESRAEIAEKEMKQMASAKEKREIEEKKLTNKIILGAWAVSGTLSRLFENIKGDELNSHRCKLGLHDWSEKDYYVPAMNMVGGTWNLSDITNPPYMHYRQRCNNCGKIRDGKEYRGNRIFKPK